MALAYFRLQGFKLLCLMGNLLLTSLLLPHLAIGRLVGGCRLASGV